MITCILVAPSIRMDNIGPDDKPMHICASDTKAFSHKFYRTEGIDHRSTVNKKEKIHFLIPLNPI